jgi:hypothetical protein
MMNRFADDPILEELRGQLKAVEEQLLGGIFTEPSGGRTCLAGRGDAILRSGDLYFDAIVQIYLGWPADTIANSVLAMLDAQPEPGEGPGEEPHEASGTGPGVLPARPGGVEARAWPCLSQTGLLVQNAFGEAEWLTQVVNFARLRGYVDAWLAAAGAPGAALGFGVEVSCHLVRECRAFARVADLAGYPQLATTYARQAFDLAMRVREACWDERDGFFYDPADVRAEDGSWSDGPVRRAAGFAALWAGVARPDQVKRMVYEHLFNAMEFWTPYPVPGTSLCLPGEDGAVSFLVSVPANYMLYHGLRNYGYRELASLLAHVTQRLVRPDSPCLGYDPEDGAGWGGFAGRSLLACFLPFEEQCGTELMNWRSKDPARDPGGT